MSMHDDQPIPPPEKRGMSGGTKVLLVLGGVAGICLLLCCGGGFWLYYRFQNVIKNFATTDAVEIRERTRKIVEIDILPEFEPVTAVDMVFMKMIMYTKPGSESVLMLMEFDASMQQNREQ